METVQVLQQNQNENDDQGKMDKCDEQLPVIVDKMNVSSEIVNDPNTTNGQSDSFEITLRQSTDEDEVLENYKMDEINKECAVKCDNTNTPDDVPKINKLIDSDSEEDVRLSEPNDDSPIKKTFTKRKALIDSDSDSEIKSNVDESIENEMAEAPGIRKPYKLIDSDSEVSSHNDLNGSSPIKRKLIDTDSTSGHSVASSNGGGKKVKKLKKRKEFKNKHSLPVDSDEESENNEKQRGEDVAPVDDKEMIAIKSESQRYIREHVVDIPYHKPRMFTLKEFLGRKTVVKPTALIKDKDKGFKSNEKIKMNPEELQVFAKKIEQRKRDIRSFFKNQNVAGVAKPKTEKPIEKLKSPVKLNLPANKSGPSEPTTEELLLKVAENLNKENVAVDKTDTELKATKQADKMDKLTKLGNMKPEIRLSFNYDENSFIDLESGSVVKKNVENKAEQFMNRVLKHMNAGKQKKQSLDEHEELRRLIDCDEEYKMDVKPRGSYIKLKKQLEERIMEEKKLKFKMQEQEMQDNELDEDEDDFDECNEKLEDEDEDHDEEHGVDGKEQLVDDEIVDDDDDEQSEVNEEMEEEKVEADDDDEEMQEDDKIFCSQNSKKVSEPEAEEEEDANKIKTFSRIKKLEDDLDSSDNNEGDDYDREEPEENQLDLLENDKLFSQDVTDGKDVEDELFGLCSGRFESTQLPAVSLTLSSQVPTSYEDAPSITLSSTNNLEESGKTVEKISDDEEDDAIGVKKNRKPRKIVVSDDEDENNETEEENVESNVDDDDNDDEPDVPEDGGEQKVFDEEEEEEEMVITYDSDENDIALTVHDYEKTKQLKIKNFIEQEAELSESDWNSEDEDEKGADNYDAELGDEDEFDSNKLKHELEQIHARRMLIEDERQVQMIQDLLMPEDEEKEVRERKFRWKNLENPLSTVDGRANEDGETENNENHSEDESEEYYRKLRFERETLLQSQTADVDIDPASILIKTDSQQDDKSSTATKSITKRISIVRSERNKTVLTTNETSFLIGGSGAKNSPLTNKFRDSFLARGEQHLSSLELLTIDKLDKCASIETAITAEKSTKLFFVIDEEAKAKRKSDETLESTVKRKKIA